MLISQKYYHMEMTHWLEVGPAFLSSESTIAAFTCLPIYHTLWFEQGYYIKYHRLLVALQPHLSVAIMANHRITKVPWPAQWVADHVKDGILSHLIVMTAIIYFRIPLWMKLGTTVAIRMGSLVVPGVTQLTRVCDGSIVLLISA